MARGVLGSVSVEAAKDSYPPRGHSSITFPVKVRELRTEILPKREKYRSGKNVRK